MLNADRKEEEFELIGRILQGEKSQYRVLVDRYGAMVFHLVNRFCRDGDEADGLAQEIFVRAWEKLESFDGRSAFSTWLYSLARNVCLDHAKSVRRRDVRLDDVEPEMAEQLSETRLLPDRELMEMERWQLLEEAVRRLPEEYSVPLLMKYRDGISYEVMAERLGVGVGALKVRVHRARKEMKAWIDSVQNGGKV